MVFVFVWDEEVILEEGANGGEGVWVFEAAACGGAACKSGAFFGIWV